jgi:branched-chain amino acid transport system substrate-binding protein
MKKLGQLISLGAILLCTAPASHAVEPFNIDVVLPLTGGAAFLGKAEQLALQQAEKGLTGAQGIGGRPVKFVFHDDQSSPQTAVQLATQIVTHKPPVVLGSAIVAMCNAMAPLMKNGPVLYCLSPGVHPKKGSFMFTSSVATGDLAAALLRYFDLKGMRKIGLITSTDASGQDAAHNIRELLKQPEFKQIQLVSDTSFNPSDVSASSQIQRIKGSGPDAVIAWSTGAAIGTVFKAIADSGLDVPVATTDGNMTYAQMAQYAKFLPKNLLIPSPQWLPDAPKNAPPGQVEAKQALATAYAGTGVEPDAASSFAWDPAMLVVAALRKLGPAATAEELRNYLSQLKGFSGLNGSYDFTAVPQRGLADKNVYITRWDSDKKTWVAISGPGGTLSK